VVDENSMKNVFGKFNPQRTFAVLLVLFSFYLLKTVRSDLKAGPIVKESHPSYDVNFKSDETTPKYAKSYSGLETVGVEENPEDDLLPTERYDSNFTYDRMLLESVVSIIQGYYVDTHRVSNADVYSLSLDVLKDVLPKFKKKGRKLIFKDGKSEYNLADYSNRDLTYSELLRQIGKHHLVAQKVLKKRGSNEEYVILRGILQNLDAHSAMLLPEDYEELKQGTEGVFGGLGVLVGMRDDVLTVIKPIPKSPAQRMGIKRNDKILSIDGHKTYGSTLDRLVEHMRGAPGTKVDLEVLKHNAPSPEKISLTREVIHVDSVTSKTFRHGKHEYLYMAIDSFASRTTLELSKAINSFRKRHGGNLPGVVLDLRSNPGGLLDQAVTVADLFLEEGVIVSTRGRKNEVESATVGRHETDFPMVVLLNSDSASASEIVAGALQDHGRALVVGQQSFGKGSVQTVFELPGQRAIKLTIARYYTPKGRTIQNEGILPDIVFQPILEKNSNNNLMGDYRYRGEGALSHALSSKSILKKNNSRAIYESFYLAKQENLDNFTSSTDREFGLAKVFLKSVSEHFGKEIPKGMRRVDSQLFVATKPITQYIESQFNQVKGYLADNFKVNWGGESFNSSSLSIQVMAEERIPVIPGKDAIIPVRIFNESKKSINNVSVNLQTEELGLVSREVLVGEIPENSSVVKKIKIKIPSFWEENLVEANLALAVNGHIVTERSTFRLDIKSRVPAVLSALIKLVNERGGKLKGKLEANERAKIEVEIVNNSDAPANATDVKILNLAGNQISIKNTTLKGVKIPPKSKKKVLFDIVGAQKVYDKKLVLGVYLDSNDLIQPYRKELNILGNPGKWNSGGGQALSH
jgi:carboxyl-terminal processing protease